jgi:hypothetical protein
MHFKNLNVELNLNPHLKHGDFRDWFIIDPDKPKIHETEIKFFINDEFIYKEMMPINTKKIKYFIESHVNSELMISKIKWVIPEMEYEKETMFDNPTVVLPSDTFRVDGEIDFSIGD